jgi:hypothetical protein
MDDGFFHIQLKVGRKNPLERSYLIGLQQCLDIVVIKFLFIFGNKHKFYNVERKTCNSPEIKPKTYPKVKAH